MYFTDEEIVVPLSKKFSDELKKQGRTITWLAAQMNFSFEHTHGLLSNKRTITEKSRQKMNELLSTSF